MNHALTALALLLAAPAAAASTVIPSTPGRTVEQPRLFLDGDRLGLATFRDRNDGPGEVAVRRAEGDGWTSPQVLDFGNGNLRQLQDAITLSSGRPMLITTWDPTDYIALLGLEAEAASLQPDAPFPWDGEHLLDLMHEVGRVHVLLGLPGGWSAPLPVHGTRQARGAKAAAGPDDSAMVLVLKDEDGDRETVDDVELYAVAYSGGGWSEALRLTDNSVPEFGASLAWTGDAFTVAWGSDGDGDLSTPDDKRVHAVRVGVDGQPRTGEFTVGPFSAGLPPGPVVTSEAGAPALLWLGAADEAGLRSVEHSRFAGGWSAPSPAGFAVSPPLQALSLAGPDGELLVVRDGSRFHAASFAGGWHLSSALLDLASEGAHLRDWDALIDADGQLQLATTAVVRPDGGSVVDPQTLRHSVVPLAADLAILLARGPRDLQPGDEGTLRVAVQNRGAVASVPTAVELEGLELLAPVEVPPLLPGELIELDLPFAATTAAHGAVLLDGDDADPSNDRRPVRSAVHPDYSVRSVRVAGGTARIDLAEGSGAFSAPVEVEVALETPEGRTELLRTTWDPRDPRPLVLEDERLVDLQAPARVVARVNGSRAVPESDWSDNTRAWQDRGEADFRVLDVAVEGDVVLVTVEALSGDVDEVGVVVVGSGREATEALSSGWQGDAAVALLDDGVGQARVALPDGEFLHAVVNPGQGVRERLRRDNVLRFSRGRTARIESDLRVDEAAPMCGHLGLNLSNAGGSPALGAWVTIEQGGLPVRELVVPALAPGGTARLIVDPLDDGEYRAVLHRPDRRRGEPIALDFAFEARPSLDFDGDGWESKDCGGEDCDDTQADVYPGSADFDEDCEPTLDVGWEEPLPDGCGCSSSGSLPPAWGLLLLLGLRRRTR